jgi:hypothetical protein
MGLAMSFLAACAVLQWASGAYGVDRGQTADEAAHFVNSLLIIDYVSLWPWTNPMAFATDYYLHFPRVSIGHWPPFFHMIQALVLGLFGRSSATALAFQAVIAAMAASGAALVTARRHGMAWGAAAGLMVLASPQVLIQLDTVMVDTFLAVLVLASAASWGAYARTRHSGWAMAFALCSAAAILTKGNAFGLALLPLVDCALRRDLRLLLRPATLAAAALVALPTVPWYLLTYRIAADGFVFGWGWSYTSQALPAYARALAESLGIVGIAALVLGGMTLVRREPVDTGLSAQFSAVVGLLLFQVLAPADIQARYLVCLVPSAAVVAIHFLARVFASRRAVALAAGLLALNLAQTARLPHPASTHMDEIARRVIEADSPNPFVLIAGGPHAEGALIAAFAEFEPSRRHYVIRASKALADSNFMGSDYRPRFADAEEAGRWVAESGIGWLVLDTSPDSLGWRHNAQLAAAVAALSKSPPLATFPRAGGEVRLYALDPAADSPDPAALFARVAPKKVMW